MLLHDSSLYQDKWGEAWKLSNKPKLFLKSEEFERKPVSLCCDAVKS
jgi:hypothetical protein